MDKFEYIKLEGSIEEKTKIITDVLNNKVSDSIEDTGIGVDKMRRLVVGYEGNEIKIMKEPHYVGIGGLIPLLFTDIYPILDRILNVSA